MGFSHVHRPDGLNTLLSQGCILENGFHSGNGWRNLHSKDGGGRGEEPLIALVQLTSQPAVMSSS